jgi:hypothetical protein
VTPEAAAAISRSSSWVPTGSQRIVPAPSSRIANIRASGTYQSRSVWMPSNVSATSTNPDAGGGGPRL